ncbi:MAG: type II toxin-antitoxin system RelE/ParE family toxin [Firmicutes bacterium]|nr:type II toxin-antitoxin system RelE/ParE family toxin [Bacillota bacterium]
MWKIEFLPEAVSDLSRIDKAVRAQVIKGINKVAKNPVAKFKGGYGEPLRNQKGRNLSGLYKIKYRGIGIRVVYALEEKNGIMTIVIVGARADDEVYDEAYRRRIKHDM